VLISQPRYEGWPSNGIVQYVQLPPTIVGMLSNSSIFNLGPNID
jgi:hypothetical protein